MIHLFYGIKAKPCFRILEGLFRSELLYYSKSHHDWLGFMNRKGIVNLKSRRGHLAAF